MAEKTEIEQGIELWYEIADLLNTIVREEQEISIDDRRIWDQYLHRWTNEEWMLVIGAMYELNQTNPEMFKKYHLDALEATILALSMGHKDHRILDKKRNKGIEWRMIMTMREVWNSANDIFLPNQPSMKSIKPKPATTFNTLFDLEAYAGAQ
jgi:hypothetical protein